MDWIKKNYAQFALAVFALVLLGMSGMLIMNARGFEDTFASIRGEVRKNNTIEALDLGAIEREKAALEKPAAWAPKPGSGSLLVSEKYVVQDGVLINLAKGDKMLHPPVPNQWFSDNNLDMLETNVLQDDPDQDGFTNLEEWTGNNPSEPGKSPTNPQDKNSHPPFVAKLRLAKFISQPFRLLFNAYDGDPAKPDTMTFQINTIDVKQPTQFRKVGEQIEGTKFKVMKFELKKQPNPSTGMDADVSELTVQNAETGSNVVMIMEKIANSPDSYALFKFLLDGSEFKVKKDQTFALKSEPEHKYKLIDITDAEAVITDLKTQEKVKIPHL